MATTTVDSSYDPMRWKWLVRSRAWVSLLIIAPFAIACIFSKPYAAEGSWADVNCDFIGWVLFMIGLLGLVGHALHRGQKALDDCLRWPLFNLPQSALHRHILHGAGRRFLSRIDHAWRRFVADGGILSADYGLGRRTDAAQKFGQPFIEYCDRVPRFWPRFRQLRNADANFVNVPGFGLRRGGPAAGSGYQFFAKLSPTFASNPGGHGCFTCRRSPSAGDSGRKHCLSASAGLRRFLLARNGTKVAATTQLRFALVGNALRGVPEKWRTVSRPRNGTEAVPYKCLVGLRSASEVWPTISFAPVARFRFLRCEFAG